MRIPARSPQASWQRVDGETVLLQVERGELVGLNRVGGRTWELIDGVRSVEAIAAEISREFAQEPEHVAREVEAFVDELLAARLIDV